MTQDPWNAVDGYIADLFEHRDAALDAALASSAEGGLPGIQISPNQGKFLQILARSIGATSILELGTLGGYSTIWLARALPAGGRLVTLEADAHHAKIARANIVRAGLGDRVEIRLGLAKDSLAELQRERAGPFDFIFIDADKPGYPEYLGAALRLSRRGTLIVADNVVRDGTVVDAGSPDPNVQGVRRFNDILAKDARLSATVLQTVGVKGHDGFAFALVVGDPHGIG
jgi:predicted O-methyltransferase YrrM